MKSLSLYIDKWFITVAVNQDSNVLPLSLPNGEDRIWLFFHEDTANNRIVYGKSFENNYRDKMPHYFGDIFTLIESGDHHFTRYDNRPEEMKEIFKVSNIFSHLHQAISEETSVDTYLSFSSDVSDIARYKFIQELEEADFKVIESVARISHLALEESKKRGIFTANGHYLVLAATNDNLHYSLYEHTDGIFLRQSEASLPGLGLDVRRRALVESIVENVNRTTRLLSTPDELTQEYIRQDRFADEWLKKIANSHPNLNIPVAFSDITFAIAPNNPYAVSICPKDLDERTNGIVEDIVRKIAEFVKANHLQSHEINGIVFIGNTFTNRKFAAAINNRFTLKEEQIVTYKEVELPKVVSIYSQIDCNQFQTATQQFVDNAKTQETLNQQAKEEEERRLKAQEENRRQQEIRDRQRKAEQEYSNAVEYIERYESEHDYEQMKEWAEIALTHRPEDEYAKEKSALAHQLLAEQRANNKQFNTLLQRAKTAFTESRWSDAISQSEIALELKPESDEAKRIKKEAKRQLEIKEKTTNFLNRADVFFAQKLYAEALEEVGKVLNLDANNQAAKEIEHKISEVHAKIQNLTAALDTAENKSDFSAAIEICETLIEEDTPNLRKWANKKDGLISKRHELEASKRKLEELKTGIDQAHFDEEWTKLQLLCKTYLSIAQNQEISQLLVKAEQHIEAQKIREEKGKAIEQINSLIREKRFNEAEDELNRFSRSHPSDQSAVKYLRGKLFSFETDPGTSGKENPSSQSTGSGSHPSSREMPTDADNFFETSTPAATHPPRHPTAHRETKPSQTDNFFNASTTDPTEERTRSGKRSATTDDFNF